ncbi:MAG: hypothetical protein ACLFRL_04175 [Desulfohalobiaceae bacterium]
MAGAKIRIQQPAEDQARPGFPGSAILKAQQAKTKVSVVSGASSGNAARAVKLDRRAGAEPADPSLRR